MAVPQFCSKALRVPIYKHRLLQIGCPCGQGNAERIVYEETQVESNKLVGKEAHGMEKEGKGSEGKERKGKERKRKEMRGNDTATHLRKCMNKHGDTKRRDTQSGWAG